MGDDERPDHRNHGEGIPSSRFVYRHHFVLLRIESAARSGLIQKIGLARSYGRRRGLAARATHDERRFNLHQHFRKIL